MTRNPPAPDPTPRPNPAESAVAEAVGRLIDSARGLRNPGPGPERVLVDAAALRAVEVALHAHPPTPDPTPRPEGEALLWPNGDTVVLDQDVEKTGGDYRFRGLLRAIFSKRSGAVRVVVENQDGVLHIFSLRQVERINVWGEVGSC